MASVFGGGSSFGGGGLFGQQPVQGNPQQTSLFGGASQGIGGGGGFFGGQGQSTSAFGGQSQAPALGGGGLFGQSKPPSIPQGTPGIYGGGQPSTFGHQSQGGLGGGGLFGQQTSQGQTSTFSQGLQGSLQGAGGAGGAGLFGNIGGQQNLGAPQTSSFGGFNSIAQSSQSGFTNQQSTAPGASIFGGASSTGAFGGGGGSGGTGLFGTGQTPAMGSFGSQPTTSLFGQQQQQQKPVGGMFGNPSQGAPGFVQPSAFGAPQGFVGQQSQGVGGGLFGQPQQPQLASQASFGGSSSLFGQQQQPGLQQQLPGAINQGGLNPPGTIYADVNDYSATLTSINVHYNQNLATVTVMDNKVKDPVPNLTIQNIRGHPQFRFVSSEMLRVIDVMQMKNQQIPNYEYTAMNEFKQNPQKYPLLEASKQRAQQSNMQQQPSGFGGIGQQQQTSQFAQSQFQYGNPNASQGGGLFGQPQTPGFSAFNKPLQQTQGLGSFQSTTQAQPLGGGLFGQPAATQGLGGGGLFGQQQSQPQQSSLFASSNGQPQQQPGGGLFGNPVSQQPGQSSSTFQTGQVQGGLFGPQSTAQPGAQPQQQQLGTGLFGQQSQTTPGASTGLFFNNQQKPAGSSLFGPSTGGQVGVGGANLFQQQPKPGGIFGPTPNQGQPSAFNAGQPSPFNTGGQPQAFSASQPTQQNLFGPATMQPATPSLFAPQGQTQPQSFLFNPGAQPSTPGSSLFGPPQQQQSMFQGQLQTAQSLDQPQIFNPMSIYQSQDPYGINSGFMAKPADSIEAIKQELEAIRQSAEKLQRVYTTANASSNNTLTAQQPTISDYGWIYPNNNQSVNCEIQLDVQLDARQREAMKEEEERLRAKQIKKYGFGSEIHRNEIQALRKTQEKEFGASFSYIDLSKRPAIEPLYQSRTMETFDDRRLRTPRTDPSEQVPDLSRNKSKATSTKSSQNPMLSKASTVPADSKEKSPVQNSDTLTVTVTFKHENFPPQELKVTIHKSRDVQDLWSRTLSWMTEKFNYEEDQKQKFALMFKNRILDQKSTLKDAGIIEDAKVFAQIFEDNSQSKDQVEEVKLFQDEEKKQVVRPDSLPEKEQVPKAPKDGYKINPDMVDLHRMTISELQAVEGLKVWNNFGSVEFIGKTDVTGVDFADIITITKNNVEVFDDERHKLSKPPIGQKLNKPAVIVLNDIRPRKDQTGAQKEEKLKASLEKDPEGAEHLSYDSDRFIWEFKVFHFTKWGAEEESEEEEPNQAESQVYSPKKEEVKATILPQKQGDLIGFKAPFEESIRLKETVEDAEMVSGKEALGQEKIRKLSRYPGKQAHLESESERDSVVIRVEPAGQQKEMRLFSTQLQKRDKASRIEENIRQRELAFKKVSPMTCTKPSDKETIEFLKAMGINKGFSKTSLRSGIPRPTFSPNGQIAFVSGNKIRIVPTVPVEMNSKLYTPAQTVLNHLQIGQNLGDQMESMSISQTGVAQVIADTSQVHFARKMLFNDNFFHDLLKKQIPKVTFCPKEVENCSQLSRFLTDLAKEMAQEKTEKLKHEFTTVCMLNALFGNPNLNLVQLHPSYKGPKTIARDLETYRKAEVESDNCILTQKKRRNAVCEVLRFHCQLVYKVNVAQMQATDDQVYERALQLLRIGDLKGAIKHLNSHKKNKLAMLVARSINQSGGLFQSYVKNLLGQGRLHQGIQRICAHLSATEQNEAQSLDLPWDQELLRSIVFSDSSTQSFTDLVRSKDTHKNFGPAQTKSILWSLLRFYANCRDAEQSFKQFANEISPSCSQRDYRLRWITQLVLRQSLSESVMKGNQQQLQGAYGKKANIEDCFFVHTSSQYVRQLLLAKDWRSALAICMMIPTQHEVIRGKLIFEILCSQAGRFIQGGLESTQTQQSIVQRMGLPTDWVQTSLALCLQSLNLYELAIQAWIKAGNYQQAHTLWHEKILPLYMNRSSGVQLVKALQLGDILTQAERATLIREQKICERTALVDKMVADFARFSSMIKHWDSKTGNFKKFIELLENLAKQGSLTGDACRSYRTIIASIQAFSRDDEKDAVDHFIGQEIATIGNLLRMKEDEANAREGKNFNAGVIHYSGGGLQFKLASDHAFIALNKPRIAREAEQLVVSQLLNRLATQ